MFFKTPKANADAGPITAGAITLAPSNDQQIDRALMRAHKVGLYLAKHGDNEKGEYTASLRKCIALLVAAGVEAGDLAQVRRKLMERGYGEHIRDLRVT